MKNNHGFSNILIIILVLGVVLAGGYFGYTYLNKNEPQKQTTEKTIKKEITKLKPEISETKDYYEVIDSNSSNKVSFKLSKNVVFDQTARFDYDRNNKLNISQEVLKINDSNLEGFAENRQNPIYVLSYTFKSVIPTKTTKTLNTTGKSCLGDTVVVKAFNQNIDSLVKNYYGPDFSESNLNNFKSYYTYNENAFVGMDFSTYIKADENYTIKISYNCGFEFKKEEKDPMKDVYEQIVNSFTKVN